MFENHGKSPIQHCDLRAKRATFAFWKIKTIRNVKNAPFWQVFENLKLAVKQCYQTGQFCGNGQNSNATFLVIFKLCALLENLCSFSSKKFQMKVFRLISHCLKATLKVSFWNLSWNKTFAVNFVHSVESCNGIESRNSTWTMAKVFCNRRSQVGGKQLRKF